MIDELKNKNHKEFRQLFYEKYDGSVLLWDIIPDKIFDNTIKYGFEYLFNYLLSNNYFENDFHKSEPGEAMFYLNEYDVTLEKSLKLLKNNNINSVNLASALVKQNNIDDFVKIKKHIKDFIYETY